MYVCYHVRVIGVFQGLAIDLKDLIGHFKIGFLGRWTWKDRIDELELVSKELNHLAAILHVYAGGLNFMKYKKKCLLLFFKKKMGILLHF